MGAATSEKTAVSSSWGRRRRPASATSSADLSFAIGGVAAPPPTPPLPLPSASTGPLAARRDSLKGRDRYTAATSSESCGLRGAALRRRRRRRGRVRRRDVGGGERERGVDLLREHQTDRLLRRRRAVGLRGAHVDQGVGESRGRGIRSQWSRSAAVPSGVRSGERRRSPSAAATPAAAWTAAPSVAARSAAAAARSAAA